ncbi:carboxymuconolactone decarboxylase family protein [Halobellus captivus]|uniref:carboxymuconolactone decarboxylase family protein n=1 Tax=Halobellus captivus TaxID=2592614 RepID=UPI001396AC5C|nr:peroxidase-related enzyme [Halobellus captivus]
MALLEYVDPETAELPQYECDSSEISLFRAVLLNNPTVLERRLSYSGWLRNEGSLERELKELAHVVVDRTNECEYCTDAHTQNLVEVFGFSEERIDAIENREFDTFDDRERAVMRFAEQVTEDPKRVTDDHIEALRTVGFSDADVVELLALVTSAISANAMMDALNVHPVDRQTM